MQRIPLQKSIVSSMGHDPLKRRIDLGISLFHSTEKRRAMQGYRPADRPSQAQASLTIPYAKLIIRASFI